MVSHSTFQKLTAGAAGLLLTGAIATGLLPGPSISNVAAPPPPTTREAQLNPEVQVTPVEAVPTTTVRSTPQLAAFTPTTSEEATSPSEPAPLAPQTPQEPTTPAPTPAPPADDNLIDVIVRDVLEIHVP